MNRSGQLNHTPRTLAFLRERGYVCETVEKWKRFPDKGKKNCEHCQRQPEVSLRQDLFNFADVIAFRLQGVGERHTGGIVLAQITSYAHHADRRNKVIASPEAKLWILAGGHILIASWQKPNNRWEVRQEWISLDQFVCGLPDTIEQYQEDQARQKLLARGEVGVSFKRSPIKDSELPF